MTIAEREQTLKEAIGGKDYLLSWQKARLAKELAEKPPVQDDGVFEGMQNLVERVLVRLTGKGSLELDALERWETERIIDEVYHEVVN